MVPDQGRRVENAMHPESGSNSDRPLAIAQSESMKVRTGPGLDNKVITTVPQGVADEIYGIDPTKNWFQVETEGLDTLAWVLRDMTWVDGLLVSVRRTTPREVATWPALITQPPTLLARSGPGRDYPAVARLPKEPGSELSASARTLNGSRSVSKSRCRHRRTCLDCPPPRKDRRRLADRYPPRSAGRQPAPGANRDRPEMSEPRRI